MKHIFLILVCSWIMVGSAFPQVTYISEIRFDQTGQLFFKGPFGISVSKSNHLLIADDLSHQLFVFQGSGKLLKVLGKKGQGTFACSYPDYFIQGPGKKLFIADTGYNRILILDQNFNLNKVIKHWGWLRKGFLNPRYIAFDSDSRMFVADWGNHCIRVFEDEEYHFSIGRKGNGKGEFNSPIAVAVDHRNRVFVSDFKNHRIQVFNSNGQFLYSFGKKGDQEGDFVNPSGLAIDRQARLFIVDRGNHRVQVFTLKGEFIFSFGGQGVGQGQFRYPSDVAASLKNTIYVVDKGNCRIQEFECL